MRRFERHTAVRDHEPVYQAEAQPDDGPQEQSVRQARAEPGREPESITYFGRWTSQSEQVVTIVAGRRKPAERVEAAIGHARVGGRRLVGPRCGCGGPLGQPESMGVSCSMS
ncbi:hypothetical protein GCM10010359_42710 [Streptomyces morookaense]|nr:hypothetical protein GCM10010359_42710 [Streptomyces morookaense]